MKAHKVHHQKHLNLKYLLPTQNFSHEPFIGAQFFDLLLIPPLPQKIISSFSSEYGFEVSTPRSLPPLVFLSSSALCLLLFFYPTQFSNFAYIFEITGFQEKTEEKCVVTIKFSKFYCTHVSTRMKETNFIKFIPCKEVWETRLRQHNMLCTHWSLILLKYLVIFLIHWLVLELGIRIFEKWHNFSQSSAKTWAKFQPNLWIIEEANATFRNSLNPKIQND